MPEPQPGTFLTERIDDIGTPTARLIPWGTIAKVILVIALIVAGYWIFREKSIEAAEIPMSVGGHWTNATTKERLTIGRKSVIVYRVNGYADTVKTSKIKIRDIGAGRSEISVFTEPTKDIISFGFVITESEQGSGYVSLSEIVPTGIDRKAALIGHGLFARDQ